MPILRAYLQLTKPSIMLLVIFTGATALFVEGSFVHEPLKFALVLIGLFLTGGSANALNQYLEREVDAKMSRTKLRRPLPQGVIKPLPALIFSLTIGLTGVLLFGFVFNWLTAFLSLGTIIFYAAFYTLLLKPSTPQNIVIGGAAGAMAPVGAWAAATESFAAIPWILFFIIFLWTPPHFWALALFCKDDYVKAKLPMMPVVRGVDSTLKQILYYTIVLVVVSWLLVVFHSGIIYVGTSILCGGVFLYKAYLAMRDKHERSFRSLFAFSIIYLFALFASIIVDTFVGFQLLG